MANTIQDLYLKYVNRVGRSLENDRYFQYLFEIVRAGSTTLEQKNSVLHKVVDERWLTIIEDTLEHINIIIEKPRRFVTTREEVVPVGLARKITADSVRHLSQNTQFIAGDGEDGVMPTRILNVSTEESFDLYENRFIYHLIQHLVTFIDKRTDVIFWSTGDEVTNSVKMQSQVDDAYEQIEYKLEMTVKNKQSFAENDSENMTVFMRIDRVRRMVMALRNSAFCSLMHGCSVVRSPIQRTNLMMKDPHYRACYKLWQFLESYDEVGYSIDAKDTALEFDEEYQIQMFTNLITNYTIFKSLIENDARKLEETPPRHHKVIKPKFIKKIEEQIVNDYDIPDVEIRKIIIEKVTQAQLDAEKELEEEIERRMNAENARVEAEHQMRLAQAQAEAALQASAEAQIKVQKLEILMQETEERLEAAENAVVEADEQIETTRQELEKMGAELESERQTSRSLEQKAEDLQTELEGVQADCAAAKQHIAALEQALAESKEQTAQKAAALDAAEKHLKEMNARAAEMADMCQTMQRKVTEAKNAEVAALRQAEEQRAAREASDKAREQAVQAQLAAETAASESRAQTIVAMQQASEARQQMQDAQELAAKERTMRLSAEDAVDAAQTAQTLAETERDSAIKNAEHAAAERDKAIAEIEAAKAAAAAESRARAEAEAKIAGANEERDKALQNAQEAEAKAKLAGNAMELAENEAAKAVAARKKAERDKAEADALRAEAERIAEKANEARQKADRARKQAEKTAEDEIRLRELVERRAGSDSLGEFLRSRREERLERKNQSRKD